MTSFDIDRLVEQGKMTQVLRKWQKGCCMSESLADILVNNNVTEFANFAYTDYGCLTNRGGIFDYAIIRYFKENYEGKGCEIEVAGFGGDNMILYGDALKHLREEFMPYRDEMDDLLQGMTDYIDEYERENFRKQAEDAVKYEPFKDCDIDTLFWAIKDCDSGMNTNGMADYSEDELLKTYNELLALNN